MTDQPADAGPARWTAEQMENEADALEQIAFADEALGRVEKAENFRRRAAMLRQAAATERTLARVREWAEYRRANSGAARRVLALLAPTGGT